MVVSNRNLQTSRGPLFSGENSLLVSGRVTVRWSLVTLPTFWSLVTLPTSLGRVASDPFVLFLWPCSLKNTSHRILFWVVACDPTYLFGRVASDHFLALAIPKHLPWPDLHSDRIWPYRPTCHRKHGFCVAGATISMLLRCSPLTLYMLVGKCQMAFVWQVQQFWCLWDDLPWPYTCLLGRVASDWQWLCVAIVWPAQYFQCLREVLCDPMFGDTGDPTCFLCGRCRILDGSEKFLVYTFCLCGRCNILDTSEKVTVTLREFPRDTSSVLWQVPSLPPSSSAWPYTFALCGRRNIFRRFRTFFARPGPKGRLWPHLLFVWQVQIIGDNGDPTFFLCGRCNIFDASGKFLGTLFLFCVAGALVTRPPRSTLWPHVLFVWQVLYVRCLRQVLVTWTQGSLVTPPLFWCGRPPRSSADTAKGWLWPYVLFVWHVQ